MFIYLNCLFFIIYLKLKCLLSINLILFLERIGMFFLIKMMIRYEDCLDKSENSIL